MSIDHRYVPALEGLRDYGFNFSRATFDRMIADGRLPKPLKTHASRTGRLFFRVDELKAAIESWRTDEPNAA